MTIRVSTSTLRWLGGKPATYGFHIRRYQKEEK